MNERTSGPDLSGLSHAPRYTMQAVERATGISPRTLRSWERRYSVPAPQRSAGGRRLYSEQDLALIRWLMEQVAEGMSIGRAVSVVGERDSQLPAGLGPVDLDRFQLRLLQAIDWMEEDEVLRLLEHAVAVEPLDAVVFRLIQPVLSRIGELWVAGRMSVASEHMGTNIIRFVLLELLQQSPEHRKPFHVMVGCAPGEQHDLGALVLALFLRRAGLRVTYLGANLEGESLKADLRRIMPNALCLSATTASAGDELCSLYSSLDGSFDGVLAYGGSAFAGPESTRELPGLHLPDDVRAATDTLGAVLEANHAALEPQPGPCSMAP